MRGGTRGRGELLGSSVFVTSVSLLLVNDRVLKAKWPGLVTGKLSDVAGVAMVAIALTVLVRRPTISFAATAVAFTVLKTVPVAALWAAPMLGGVTRTDPTDLLALLVLVPLWHWTIRVVPGTSRSGWSVPLRVVAVACAVVATTATSSDCSTGVSGLSRLDGSRLIARGSGGPWTSVDGGRTWLPSAFPTNPPDWQATQACSSDGDCFDVVRRDGSAVGIEESNGQGRAMILAIGIDVERAIEELDPQSCAAVGDAIAAVDIDGVVHVVVSMGVGGVLHRDPTSNEWEWVRVGDWGVPAQVGTNGPGGFVVHSAGDPAPTLGIPRIFALVLMLLPGLAAALSVVPIRRWAGRNRRDPVAAIAVCIAASILLGLAGLVVFALAAAAQNTSMLLGSAAALAVVALGVVVPFAVYHRRPRRLADWKPPAALDPATDARDEQPRPH